MPIVRWDGECRGPAADGREAELLRDWLVERGWTLDARPAWALGGPRPARVHFGWGRGNPDLRMVTDAPAAGSGDVWSTLTVIPDAEMRADLESRGVHAERLWELPYPVPDEFYDWSDMGPVFEVTRRHRLESRPRIVASGDWQRGQALTRLLPAARRVLGQGGELVLLDSLAHRTRIAPAVAAAGLPEAVIFLPELSMSELAGLFRSADLFCQLDVEQGYPVLMRWALATGLPAVGVDHALSRRASGRAFLAVDASRADAWPAAISSALTRDRLREEIMRRAAGVLDEARLSRVGPLFEHLLSGIQGDGQPSQRRSRPGRRKQPD